MRWQVTNLEISKRLKELGVVQKSLFERNEYKNYNDITIKGKMVWRSKEVEPLKTSDYIGTYSTYNSDELGIALPKAINKNTDNEKWIWIGWTDDAWQINYGTFSSDGEAFDWLRNYNWEDEYFANALGKMLIYLLENKKIDVKDCNKRLEGVWNE